MLQENWTEILPGALVREQALRAISVHDLRAADALQLAAALVWAGPSVSGQGFVCLDQRLAAAAESEGFRLLPEN